MVPLNPTHWNFEAITSLMYIDFCTKFDDNPSSTCQDVWRKKEDIRIDPVYYELCFYTTHLFCGLGFEEDAITTRTMIEGRVLCYNGLYWLLVSECFKNIFIITPVLHWRHILKCSKLDERKWKTSVMETFPILNKTV